MWTHAQNLLMELRYGICPLFWGPYVHRCLCMVTLRNVVLSEPQERLGGMGGGRDHTEAEENVAVLPQSPNCMKYWGSWPFSLVATVRKLLELLSQCPFCRVENFKKSLLRNGCGIFIQMNQTSRHHLSVPSLGHTQSPALLWDLPKDTPSSPPPGSIPESLAFVSAQTLRRGSCGKKPLERL